LFICFHYTYSLIDFLPFKSFYVKIIVV
jgi:hypothetical protein